MKRELIIFSSILFLLIFPVVTAQDINISQPSANETILAEMRDFYVYGIFPAAVTNPGDIKIELYAGDGVGGALVRTIQSQVDPVTGITNESVIDTTYANGTRKNNVMVPDLVKSPGTLQDTTNKVVVTNNYYLGLILGGATKNFDTNYKDGTGATLTDLTAGNYTIKVTGLSGNLAGQTATEMITFGLTNATLGSFRNIPNKNRLIQYTITNNRRTYFDWFPSYFTDPTDSNKWYEGSQRWQPNNGIEVVNDRPGTLIDNTVVANNTMFMYNINDASATYAVELAAILKYNLVDSINTTFFYYDNGEPTLTYNNSVGTPQQVISTLKQFSGNTKLALNRLEVRDHTSTSYENVFDPNETTWKWVYTDLSGTIGITQGQTFTIYGVVKPIASTVTAASTPYRFSIDNRTAHVVCNITDTNNNLVLTSTHDVNLSRYYDNYPGSSNPYKKYNSLFEFGAEVTTLSTPGTYTVFLNGTDVSGATVNGASATFTLQVVPTPIIPPDSGGASSPPSANPQIVIRAGAPANVPILFPFTGSLASGNMVVQSVTLYPSSTTGEVECIVQPLTPGTALQITDRDVAGYMSIVMNWISPGAINHADIMFSVDNAWLAAHALTPEDVVMLRYVDNQWIALPTKLDHTTGEKNYYVGTTPGFSYFAAAGKPRATNASPNATMTMAGGSGGSSAKTVAASTPTGSVAGIPTALITPAPVLTPRPSPTRLSIQAIFFPNHGLPVTTIVAWAVVIIVLIIAVFVIRRWWTRRQNPALFRKYD